MITNDSLMGWRRMLVLLLLWPPLLRSSRDACVGRPEGSNALLNPSAAQLRRLLSRQLLSRLSFLLSCSLSCWAPCKKSKQCCFEAWRAQWSFPGVCSASGKRNDAREKHQLCAP